MSDFVPNPLYVYGRIDTSAGEGGESLVRLNPTIFGVSEDGTIGRGAEVDGAATSEDIVLGDSGSYIESTDGKAVAEFAPAGGTIDTSGPEGVHHEVIEAGVAEEVVGDPTADAEAIAEDAVVQSEVAEVLQDGSILDAVVVEEEPPSAPLQEEVAVDAAGETFESLMNLGKDDLIALANERSVSPSGNKSEIAARLLAINS